MAARVSLGTTIAGFRLERLLGQGGMGVVYLAVEQELGRSVALKLLPQGLAEDEEYRERFLREARLAASLDHPCVVPIYQAGEVDGQLFLAMRYVEGEDLANLIAREGPLGVEQALGLLSSLAAALDAAHARGLLHRDVKPHNVLVDTDGHVYLCDFGIARLQGATAFTQTGALTGTLGYLAPEVIEGRPASAASDLYALACLGYELLSGSPPFSAEHDAALIYRQLKDAPPPLGAQPQLDAVFQIALAKDPGERYATCLAFLEALAEPPAVVVTAALTVNLPTPATRFLGREQELAEAAMSLATTRLLTITGPGGAGKTRFAVELARRQAESYPDGVHWVPLADLTDPELVLVAIGRALAIKDELELEIHDRRLLLLLDNFEQVVTAAPELVALLSSCSNLTLVCTSRERLRVQPEVEYELPALEAEDGVSIFCERSGLEPSGTIGELCERLEGLPLAIELAAARTRLLSPEQLVERLSQRLDLLKGTRDAGPHQETLRATIDWSFELLTPMEQKLFQRLAVFSGGCTLEAAEEVCEADLDTMESLLDKSLTRRREDRFTMLETIREYAVEKLEKSDEAEELRQRHAEWVVALARETKPLLEGREQARWLDRLEQDQGNLRTALNHLQDSGQTDLLLDLLNCTANLWELRAGWSEPRGWFEYAIGASEGQRTSARAWVLLYADRVPGTLGDLGRSEALATESLSIFRELGDQRGIGWALLNRGAELVVLGRFEEAQSLLEDAIERLDEAGDQLSASLARGNLANINLQAGDYDRAASIFEYELANNRELGVPDRVAFCLSNLAFARLRAGHPDLAVSPARESLELSLQLGYRIALAYDLYLLSALAGGNGESEMAATLLGGADALRDDLRLTLDSTEAALADELRSEFRRELGDERYEALVAEGRELALEEAVALALEAVPEPPPVEIKLPTPLTSFLGRKRELAEAAGLLTTGRLLTVTGPGGAGKTRFAVELCRRQAQNYPDGVHWVPLATVTDPELVPEAIRQALDVPGDLQVELEDKRLLLLLDNLEQLVEAAPELARLVEACPELTLLCASRERLHIQAETEYPLPALADADGVSLFCERSGLQPSETITELCSRLEGLPLAIELAAARTRLLSLEQLLERLSSRLDLLKGPRDADPRQQTLRATIDWSYELLTEEEQRLFCRLSVFSGGCTLEAAEEVCEAELDALESLLDKSLVRRSDDRFTMLETIREYASEKLEASGEADAIRQRHAELIVALGRQAEEGMRGAELTQWLERLAREHANLSAALNWLLDTEQTDLLLELLGSLFYFWEVRGSWFECRAWLDGALARSEGQRTSGRAKTLLSAGAAHTSRGGGRDAAIAAEEESLSIFRELGDERGITRALSNLGVDLVASGDFVRARQAYEEAMVCARRSGNHRSAVITAGNLADLALQEGDYARAVAAGEQAVAESRQLGQGDLIAYCLGNLSEAYLLSEQPEPAMRAAREALEIARPLGYIGTIVSLLLIFAALAARRGEPEQAARLSSAVKRLGEDLTRVLDGVEAELFEATVNSLRGALGDERYGALVSEGAAMTLEEAVDLALGTVPEQQAE